MGFKFPNIHPIMIYEILFPAIQVFAKSHVEHPFSLSGHISLFFLVSSIHSWIWIVNRIIHIFACIDHLNWIENHLRKEPHARNISQIILISIWLYLVQRYLVSAKKRHDDKILCPYYCCPMMKKKCWPCYYIYSMVKDISRLYLCSCKPQILFNLFW